MKKGLIIMIVLIGSMFMASCSGENGGDNGDNDTSTLSLYQLRKLAQEGELLSWEHFEGYDFEEIGSGLYIRSYPIEGTESVLLISGKSLRDKPDSIKLIKASGEEIDVRAAKSEEQIS